MQGNATPPEAGLSGLSALIEVPLDVAVELGRRVMTIGEILDLRTGSVIRMDRSAGENIDIIVGDFLVGFGEIVLIEDVMGVRMTDFDIEV